MKNVFIIHSGICYLMSREIIRINGYSPSNCVAIYFRSFPLKLEGVEAINGDTLYDSAVPAGFGEGSRLAPLEAYFSKVLPESFRLYSPGDMNLLYRAIGCSFYCREVSYFEEGLIVYRDNPRYYDYRLGVSGFGYGLYHKIFNRLPVLPAFGRGEADVWCVSDDAFYKIPQSRKRIIDIAEAFGFEYSSLNFSEKGNKILFVHQPFFGWGQTAGFTLINCFDNWLSVNENFGVDFIFHPSTTVQEERFFRSYYLGRVSFFSSCSGPWEPKLFSYDQVVGIFSTLLFYSGMLGKDVHSLLDFKEFSKIFPSDLVRLAQRTKIKFSTS